MISADIGVSTPLELMLFDGATDKFVRVRIRTTTGVLVDTIDLAHIGEGLYTAIWTPGSGGYYHANYTVYSEATYTTEDLIYSRTTEPYKVGPSTTPESVANAVWDELLIQHLDPGSAGEALYYLRTSFSPSSVATAVWDELVALHSIPNTFGDWVQAIHHYCNDIKDQVEHPIWGLDMIYAQIQNWSTTINANVLQNGTKIDALTPFILGVQTDIINAVEINTGLLQTMAIQDANDLTTIMNGFTLTNSKIDGVAALIATLQNNTTTRLVVPERLVKPATGTKNYQFHLHIYDTSGAPTAPDFAPTVTVQRLDTGLNVVFNAPMITEGAKVGAYYYVFPISAATSEYPAIVEVAVTELGVTRYVPAVTEVTEFESDLNAIQAAIAAMDLKVSDTQSKVNNPIFGLAALKTGEGAILSAIAAEATTLGLIKSKTDLIPANIATTTDINDVLMMMGTLPTLGEITGVVHNTRDAIMGPDSRNLTQVYDKWDVSTLAKTNDPRFNYLDAAITSRSILTASDVWNFGTRTLTGGTIDPISIKAIWDYLASQANVPGSIGKRIADMLDATVSSRATEAEMIALLSGVAQESTLLTTRSDILAELTICKSQLANITTKLLLVKAKTDNLPSDPASQSTVVSGFVQVRDDVANLKLEVNQVKLKTDNLPVDPASESSVQQIPTNPVLVTDARLARLDANISSRSTLTTADLAPLATKTDVLSAKGQIIAEVDQNQALINTVNNTVTHIKGSTDRIPLDPATLAAISAAETAILDAISHISSGGGSSIDPADIWSYAYRTLTQDPSSFGPDISNLATKDDVQNAVVHQYVNRMTTTFSPASNLQEVLVWAEKDGERKATTSNCNVIIKDSQGVVKWSQSSSTPNADGVYRFINPIVIGSDANYYIIMAITVDSVTRITQQAFITVG